MRRFGWILCIVAVSLAFAPLADAEPKKDAPGQGGGDGGPPPEERGPPPRQEEPRPPKEEPPPQSPPQDPPPQPQQQPSQAPPREDPPARPSPPSPPPQASDRAPGAPEDPGRPEGAGKPDETGRPEEGEERGVGRGRNDTARDRDNRSRADRENRTGPDKDNRTGADKDDRTGGRPEDPGRSEDAPGHGAPLPPGLVLESTSEPDRPGAAVHVRAGERPVDVAQGEVLIAADGVPDESDAFLVVVFPDGREEVLAPRATRAGWNTTSYENGFYRVEVRERQADGSVRTLASTRVLVENPRATMASAVAAVAAGAAVSAGASVLASRGFDLLGLAKGFAADVAGQVGEDRARQRTADRLRIDRYVRLRSLALVALCAALIAFFQTYAQQETLAEFVAALPIAGVAVLAYAACDYGAEHLLARASGATSRFRLWGPGAISLAASSLLLRAPFGYPGYVSEDDPGPGLRGQTPAARRMAGVRAVAFLGAGVGLVLLFLAAGWAWRWDFAEAGVAVALMMSAAACMPFHPLPGRDVWAWSRPAWLATAAALVGLHLLWQLALLPPALLAGAGVAGLAAFGAGLVRVRAAPSGQHG